MTVTAAGTCPSETVHGCEEPVSPPAASSAATVNAYVFPLTSEYDAAVVVVEGSRTRCEPFSVTARRKLAAPVPTQLSVTRRPSRVPESCTSVGACAICPCALATAAATSRTPKPSSGVHAPRPEAVCSRIEATCSAEREGFAAQTSAAAPATWGAAKDVPLAKPYNPEDDPGSGTRG